VAVRYEWENSGRSIKVSMKTVPQITSDLNDTLNILFSFQKFLTYVMLIKLAIMFVIFLKKIPKSEDL